MKFYLRLIRLNKGGYTDKGMYYGIGKPLYAYWSDMSATVHYVRAADRDSAKLQVLRLNTDAKFFDGTPV